MESSLVWDDRIPASSDCPDATVWSVAFSPDASQLAVACSKWVLLFHAHEQHGGAPQLIKKMKGHTDRVHSVAFSHDGLRLASGGRDGKVIIWDALSAKGLVQYKHNSALQVVAYSPVTRLLASCTDSDVGLWEQNAGEVEGKTKVKKKDIDHRVCSAAWSPNGLYLALGLENGTVEIRRKDGEAQSLIEAHADRGEVWCLAWAPLVDEATRRARSKRAGASAASSDDGNVLAVGCWGAHGRDQTLSFYNEEGYEAGPTRRLGYDACAMSFMRQGEAAYIILGGSNKELALHTRSGSKLSTIAKTADHDAADEWIWSTSCVPGHNLVATGGGDGLIAVHELQFENVHDIFADRYAYRLSMTDVVVQHLESDRKVRIKHKNHVKKVALYADLGRSATRLAVQLPDRVLVYALEGGRAAASGLDYKLHCKVKGSKTLQCKHLCVAANHLILADGCKLAIVAFTGEREREWILPKPIQFMSVVAGPASAESVLLGMSDGGVVRVFVDNPFPMELIKIEHPVRSVDLSRDGKKLAVVDSTRMCLVYNLITNELIFSAPNTTSVAWNTQIEDMLCYAGNGQLFIKNGSFAAHPLPMDGDIVGFAGSKVFALQYFGARPEMRVVDVPQSATLYQCISNSDFETAYEVACLGVPEQDWRALAAEALAALEFDVALKAAVRTRDIRRIELISSFIKGGVLAGISTQASASTDEGKSSASTKAHLVTTPADDADMTVETKRTLVQAAIQAYDGKVADAAQLYLRAGPKYVERAIYMFSDMWMWEEAKRFAEHTPQIDLSELNRKQALSLERINAWEEAAQMHAASGDYARAIEIFAQHGSLDGLISVARRINLNLGAAGASSSTTVAGAAGVGGDDSKVASSSSSSLSGKTPNSHTLSLSLKDKTELLRQCVKIFIATREFKFAREVLHKLGDIGALVKLYVEQEDWSQAFLLASAHFHEGEAERGFSNSEIYLPYAKWLAMNDRFEESQSAYRLAGQPKQSLRFINQLIMCAVVERRRDDAAYYTWLLGQEGLAALADFNARRGGRGSSGASEAQLLADWDDRRELVMTHRAYAFVERNTMEPCSRGDPERLLHAGCYLVNTLGREQPMRISQVHIMSTLAKAALMLSQFKLARDIVEQLLSMRISKSERMDVDFLALTIYSKPALDNEDELHKSLCPRCGQGNPFVDSGGGDHCVMCGHPFVRCAISFEPLLLLEVHPEDGVSDADAMSMLSTMEEPPLPETSGTGGGAATRQGGVNVMTFDSDAAVAGDAASAGEGFAGLLAGNRAGNRGGGASSKDADGGPRDTSEIILDALRGVQFAPDSYEPVNLTRAQMRALDPEHVHVLTWRGRGADGASRNRNLRVKRDEKESDAHALPQQYMVNLLESPLVKCPRCNSFFKEECFEPWYLQHGCCPVCRSAGPKFFPAYATDRVDVEDESLLASMAD